MQSKSFLLDNVVAEWWSPMSYQQCRAAKSLKTRPKPARVDAHDSREKVPAAIASCTLAIKAIPNAPRSEVVGWLGGALKVKIHAPPVEGRANDALCDFLATTLGLHRRAITVLRGGTARQKILRIDGLTLDQIRTRFPA
jgi:uncharacterized protein